MAGWHGPPDYDFSRLRWTVPILHVLTHFRLHGQLRPARHEWVGPCPLPDHAGDRSNPAAFRVHPVRRCWYCFTHCGGGDVVTLTARLCDDDFAAAARVLAALERNPPSRHLGHLAPPSQRRPFRPYTRWLPLRPHHAFLRSKGIDPDVAFRFDCGYWPHAGFLSDCIAVRLHDVAGHPLGYAGRRLSAEAIAQYGKWKLAPGFPKSDVLYNWHRTVARALASPVVLVEGPFDVMRVHQAGFPAVALLGTHPSPQQLHLLRTRSRILLLLDADAAGRDAARRLRAALGQTAITPSQALPPDCGPADLTDDHLRAILRPHAR